MWHLSWIFDSVLLFDSMLTIVSLSNLDPILKPRLIPVPIDFEHEPPIIDSHISLLRDECEFQFFDWDHEPNLTLESKLNLSQFYKSTLVPKPITLEPKSTIPSSHIILWTYGVDHNDSVMIFQDW